DLKKTIQPTRAVAANEKLEQWAELLTAGLIYYDFNESLTNPIKFQKSLDSLFASIEASINKKDDSVVADESARKSQPDDLLAKWLQPVDNGSDITKFKADYVSGTRIWAINQVQQWLNDETSTLLWLNGGAGLGKSIIAYLVSENLPPRFILGSLFFCKHDDINKNNAKRIISTMAFQLASKLPDLRLFLLKQKEKDNAKVARGETSALDMPSTAFKELILNGLHQIKQPQSDVVIIIDALDEVGKQGEQVRADFLNLIRNHVKQLPNWVRVFTTSRPEIDIYTVLNGVNSSVLLPQDSNNINDIQMFVHHHLSTQLSVEEAVDERLLVELVMRVTEKSSGVFHYARLACKSLTETSHPSWNAVVEVANRFDGGLDQIYRRVLEKVFAGVDSDTTERFQKVLGVVVTARVPLSQLSIAKLVGLTVAEVGGIILRIQSILSISNGEIKVLHKSLKDFLASKERCKNPLFYIDTVFFESIMATSCLQVMTSDVTRNMAHLDNDTIPLPRSTTDVINPCLAYACNFWISHFLACMDPRVLEHLSLFSSKSLLFWMEAGILVRCSPKEMGNEIERAAKKVAEFNTGGAVSRYDLAQELLDDAARFLWRFEGLISHNPLQIYSVGVTFTPQATKLYQTYQSARGLSGNNVKILSPVLEWGSLYKYLIGHSKRISNLSFSNDGLILISSSTYDKTVCLWDFKMQMEILKLDNQLFGCISNDQKLLATVAAGTGKVLIWDSSNWTVKSTIECIVLDYDALFAVFSPDSSTIAISGSDQTIVILDVESGSMVNWLRLDGRPRDFLPDFGFSSDGSTIMVAFKDIEIWDVKTGQQLNSVSTPNFGFQNSEEYLSAAQVSRDGNFVACGAKDGSVGVWHAKTGRICFESQGHTDYVQSVCLSGDGSKMLSASSDKSMILWDVETGQKIQYLHAKDLDGSCAISPDGKTAVSSLKNDGGIALWDLTGKYKSDGLLSQTAWGRIHLISPNGKQIACESSCGKIVLWDLESGTKTGELLGCDDVTALAWSYDEGKLISGHSNGVAKIWDGLDNFCCEKTLTPHDDDFVKSVCISKKGLLAASSLKKAEVTIVWNVSSETVMATIPSYGFTQSFSNDALFLATSKLRFSKSTDGKVTLWNLTNSSVISSLELYKSAVNEVCFSKDGRLVATNVQNCGEVVIWDVASGIELRKFGIIFSRVDSIQFSSDNGRLLVVSHQQGLASVKEWDVNTGRETRSMKGSMFNYLSRYYFEGASYLAGSDTIAAIFIVNNSIVVHHE
ncbi:hypothetical protein HDU76_004768, partial [Blyttiomyces sp. JEL0837]